MRTIGLREVGGTLGNLVKIIATPRHLSVITGATLAPARAPSPYMGVRPGPDKRQGPRPEVGGLEVG
ncbi:hypothetical protein Sgleb_47970 [Streptomyces glebosus]|uniref:Uncharacterized protein n=1 Tax=Streptomyces glebosus TaxID=249580 RepID=A0A640T0S6_9ACTN|nr:hypothetical protein [Streptomyces glebosus]GFE16750.1 hypothetical protein Sgleb_47970 [Streptomyces glebosus]GHG81657.1 hypothetical protein GCM10010513_60350 [Streptomyces glebosus]